MAVVSRGMTIKPSVLSGRYGTLGVILPRTNGAGHLGVTCRHVIPGDGLGLCYDARTDQAVATFFAASPKPSSQPIALDVCLVMLGSDATLDFGLPPVGFFPPGGTTTAGGVPAPEAVIRLFRKVPGFVGLVDVPVRWSTNVWYNTLVSTDSGAWVTYRELRLLQPLNAERPQRGDSGAVALDALGRPVGLVVATQNAAGSKDVGWYVIPWPDVDAWIQIWL